MRTVTPLAVLGQKKIESDTRKCFLVIEGAGWSITQPVPLDKEEDARRFAAKINAAAGAPNGAEAQATDIPAQIAQLAALKDQGILTAAEFQAKKAELLERM